MPGPKLQQLVNLRFQLDESLIPVLQRLKARTSEPPLRVEEDLAAIESLLWLHMGVQLRYFAIDPLKQLIESYRPLLLESLQEVGFRLQLVPELQQLFYEYMVRELDFFPRHKSGDFEDPEALHPWFRALLNTANQYVNDPTARSFVAMLYFSQARDWESAMLKQVSREDLFSWVATRKGLALGKESIYIGFLHTLEFRRALASTFSALASTFRRSNANPVNMNDYYLLETRTREITAWRMDHRDSQNRYDEIVGSLSRSLWHECEDLDLNLSVNAFSKLLTNSIRDIDALWGGRIGGRAGGASAT